MDHIKEEISNLIAQLSEDNFNVLVKNFNKEYYGSKDVRLVNGPYDGGIDLEIRTNGDLIKKNIQITVQKSKIDEKIIGDVEKAKSNVEQYSYVSTLEYYLTKKLSPTNKRELKRTAKVSYNIQLEIYDPNDFAELYEEFPSIKGTIYDIYKLETNNELLPISKQQKVLFDLLTISKDTNELRRQFIHSLLFIYLYEHNDCLEQDLINSISEQISGKGDSSSVIKGQISSLRMKDQIVTGSEKGRIKLSEEKYAELEDIIKITTSQEALLRVEIETILIPYNLQNFSKEIVDFIYKVFQENYDTDLEELSKSTTYHKNSIKPIFEALIEYIRQKIDGDQNIATAIAKELLRVCTSNDFLNKISASILFTKLYQSDQLDTYINSRNQELLLDTQILLHLICIQYKPIQTPNIYYQNVKHFYDTIKEHGDKVILQTTRDYVEEVAGQIQEAIKLNRFLSLPFFQKHDLHSKNVFYNYYTNLVKSQQERDNFTLLEFLDDLIGIEIPDFNDSNFKLIVANELEDLFDYLNIQVVHHKYYDNFAQVGKDYDFVLGSTDKYRSPSARENDLRTVLYLSTPDLHITNGVVNEAFLVTWDTVFYPVRKKVLELNKSYSYWYIYTPSKIADKISIGNFKLNPTAINQTVVSITESNFNSSSYATSFYDLMSTLFNKEDLSEVKLAQKLIELGNTTKPKKEVPISDDATQEANPMADVLLTLRNHYSSRDSHYNIDNLIAVFEDNSVTDSIYNIIVANKDYFIKHNKLMDNIYEEFNAIIAKAKNEE